MDCARTLLRRPGGLLRFGAEQPVDLETEQTGRGIEVEADLGAAGMALLLRLDRLQDILVLGEGNAELVADAVADRRIAGLEIADMQPAVDGAGFGDRCHEVAGKHLHAAFAARLEAAGAGGGRARNL